MERLLIPATWLLFTREEEGNMVDGFEGNGEGGKWLSFTHEEEGKLVDGFEGNGEGGK